jgi:serine/threonine protein kinase
MPLQPGTSLGPYQIDAPLGAGGMSEVYEATDTRLGRTVAIKVLPEHVAADPELKQRFEREAKTISRDSICFSVSSSSGWASSSPAGGRGSGKRFINGLSASRRRNI